MIYRRRVFAMGGGTGLSALLAGLKRFVRPPGSGESQYFADLSTFVTVTDDGGSSGKLKRFLQATSAIVVWSRSPPTNHSFPRSSSIDSMVLAIQGRIFPSSNQNVTLVAEQDDGERVKGETSISAGATFRRPRLAVRVSLRSSPKATIDRNTFSMRTGTALSSSLD